MDESGKIDSRFSELLSRYEGPVFHFARRMLESERAAARVLEQVMCGALNALSKGSVDEKVSIWLFQRTLMACRVFHQNASLHDSLVVEGGRDEATRIYEEALLRLPVEYREVFLLRDVLGFPIEDCSKVVGASSEQVRERSVRARLMIRRAFYCQSASGDLVESFAPCVGGSEESLAQVN